MLYQLEPRGNRPARQVAASGKPLGETTRTAGSAFGHHPNRRSRQLQPSPNFVSGRASTRRGRTGRQGSTRCPSILQQHPHSPSRGHQRSAGPQATRAAAASPVAPSTTSLPAPRPEASPRASQRGTRRLSSVPRAATGARELALGRRGPGAARARRGQRSLTSRIRCCLYRNANPCAFASLCHACRWSRGQHPPRYGRDIRHSWCLTLSLSGTFSP